jgi:hypothetical protein
VRGDERFGHVAHEEVDAPALQLTPRLTPSITPAKLPALIPSLVLNPIDEPIGRCSSPGLSTRSMVLRR